MYSNEIHLTSMHYAHPFARENVNEPKWMILVHTVGCFAVGFMFGSDCCENAINAAVTKKVLYG